MIKSSKRQNFPIGLQQQLHGTGEQIASENQQEYKQAICKLL